MALIWFNSAAELLAKGNELPGSNIFSVYSGPFPHVKDALNPDNTRGPRQDIEMVNAKVYKVTVGSDEYASLIFCRIDETGAPAWSIYCGDGQVKGDHYHDGKSLAATIRKDGKIAESIAKALDAGEWVGKVPEMAACGFFSMQKRSGRLCSHTQAVLANIPAEEMEEMATTLQSWLSGADTGIITADEAVSAEEEAFWDAAFIQHVLLVGERGSGKTYLARQAAAKYDAVFLEMQMHPSMEAWEFRAHDRAWNGKVFTVMGKLAEAVYWIQQGKRVVLFMDEFLNMNPMYTTVINSPLSLTADDTYIIETGRIVDMGDGIGRVETVEVPSDMLWVVGASNIGARYNTEITPSVRARFQIILMNTNAERTKSILEKTLAEYAMPLEFADMFYDFISRCKLAVDQNTLNEEATTRLACNVIRAVHKKAIRDKRSYKTLAKWMPVVKKQVLAEIAQVVNFENGPLEADQAEIYSNFVNESFIVKRK